MRDGRPAPNNNVAYFHKNGSKKIVESLKNKVDVSGCSYYLG